MKPVRPPRFELRGKRVFVAGHNGMVGAAIARHLAGEACEVITAGRDELDLTRQQQVEDWFDRVRPDAVFLAAAKVGGIAANASAPADFLAENLAIALNVIPTAYDVGVGKLMFLGSSCIYPRLASQPMSEDMLLTGPLEPTNEGYALAKIAGLKLVDAYRRQHGADFISVMPTNLYGRGDNYRPDESHVPAALIRRLHEAKEAGEPSVTVWGTGQARREFMSVDDLADACVFLMHTYSDDGFVNIGVGHDVAIGDFARTVAKVVGYEGELAFDTARPDGAPRKLLDVAKLTGLGWRARIGLEEGLADTYADFLAGGGRC